jgi:hypothetical protein
MEDSGVSQFDCRLYVPMVGPMVQMLPAEAGPKKTVSFAPVEYVALVDPGFRRLLAALDTLPRSQSFPLPE